LLAAAYALLASLSWGTSDFLAGRESRRATFWAVAVFSQLAALAGSAVVLAVVHPSVPPLSAVLAGMLGGVFSAIACLAQYRAFTLIKMSVVSPIMAGTSLVPVVWGLAHGEHPSGLQLAGMVLTIAGIVIISRPAPGTSQEHARLNRAGVLLTVLAAVTAGLMLVAVDYAAKSDPYWAVVSLRVVAVLIILAAVGVRGRGLGARRAGLPAVVAAGLLIAAANELFTAASTIGLLSVVAVLAYLSPAVVIFWALVVLRERLRPVQWVAAAVVLAGVVCLALG